MGSLLSSDRYIDAALEQESSNDGQSQECCAGTSRSNPDDFETNDPSNELRETRQELYPKEGNPSSELSNDAPTLGGVAEAHDASGTLTENNKSKRSKSNGSRKRQRKRPKKQKDEQPSSLPTSDEPPSDPNECCGAAMECNAATAKSTETNHEGHPQEQPNDQHSERPTDNAETRCMVVAASTEAKSNEREQEQQHKPDEPVVSPRDSSTGIRRTTRARKGSDPATNVTESIQQRAMRRRTREPPQKIVAGAAISPLGLPRENSTRIARSQSNLTNQQKPRQEDRTVIPSVGGAGAPAAGDAGPAVGAAMRKTKSKPAKASATQRPKRQQEDFSATARPTNTSATSSQHDPNTRKVKSTKSKSSRKKKPQGQVDGAEQERPCTRSCATAVGPKRIPGTGTIAVKLAVLNGVDEMKDMLQQILPKHDGHASPRKAGTNVPPKMPTSQKGMPKRPLEAFNQFFQVELQQWLLSKPNPEAAAIHTVQEPQPLPTTTASKHPFPNHFQRALALNQGFDALAIATPTKWKALDPSMIEHYQKLADDDLERYRHEMKVFEGKPKSQK